MSSLSQIHSVVQNISFRHFGGGVMACRHDTQGLLQLLTLPNAVQEESEHLTANQAKKRQCKAADRTLSRATNSAAVPRADTNTAYET